MRSNAGPVLMTLFLGACASSADYIPEQHATATLGGRTAAEYELPSEAEAQADVRVASFGIAKVDRQGQGSTKAVHVRFAITNNGDQPVTFDTAQQRVQFDNGEQAAPAYAKADGTSLPDINVAPHSARTVDIFFPIPQDLANRSQQPHFDVSWRVGVGDRVVARLTPFEKVAVDPAVAREQASREMAYGAYDWYDPVWGPAYIGWPGWYW